MADPWVEALVVPLVERMDYVSVGLMVHIKDCWKDNYLAVVLVERLDYTKVAM